MIESSSNPEYIQIPMASPAPICPKAVSYSSEKNGVTGLWFQFIKPTTVTTAKATTMMMESTVLTMLTSRTPRMLMMKKIRIMITFRAMLWKSVRVTILPRYPMSSTT